MRLRLLASVSRNKAKRSRTGRALCVGSCLARKSRHTCGRPVHRAYGYGVAAGLEIAHCISTPLLVIPLLHPNFLKPLVIAGPLAMVGTTPVWHTIP
ncbi:hypothetical protein BDN67DRAFT_662507 [Paxillus ammoniavirescens]|nr:hypothetical protein BDN67DRAFT_662507 [Paxillus ammoniavirescens]